MLTLIIGGAASGKSEYAERLAAAAPGPRVYLATMRRHDAECEARIEKHRAARAGRGFVTCEREAGLSGLALPAGTRTVLLEDLGNLAANELYGGAGEGAFDAALAGIDELCARAARVYGRLQRGLFRRRALRPRHAALYRTGSARSTGRLPRGRTGSWRSSAGYRSSGREEQRNEKLLRSLAMAFSMYSILPAPRVEWKAENMRYAFCFFPLIGVVIGAAEFGWLWLCRLFGVGRG